MKIAVTAASGHLGSAIVKATTALQGTQVVALARTPANAVDLGVEVRPGNYDEPDELERSLQSADVVPVVSGMDAPARRIEQHRNVIEAARSAGVGKPITQTDLAEYLNEAFGTHLSHTPMTVEEYRNDRVAELGEFIGSVIAGIYEGIREGAADNPSDYAEAAGREHVSWPDFFARLAEQHSS